MLTQATRPSLLFKPQSQGNVQILPISPFNYLMPTQACRSPLLSQPQSQEKLHSSLNFLLN